MPSVHRKVWGIIITWLCDMTSNIRVDCILPADQRCKRPLLHKLIERLDVLSLMCLLICLSIDPFVLALR
jgi:hypothetical protein